MISKKILSNGITLIQQPIENVKTCAIGVGLPFGSRHESKSINGYTHFLEHILFKGTKKFSTLQIATNIEKSGGQINGYTDKEEIFFQIWIPTDSLAIGLDTIVSMLFEPLFDPKEIKREISVVVNEIEAIKDDPDDLIQECNFQEIFQTNSLANPIAGLRKTIEKITPESIRQFYNDIFSTKDLIFTIVGNYKSINIVELFSELPIRSGNSPSFEAVTSYKNKGRVLKSEFNQIQILLSKVIEGTPSLEDSLKAQLCSNVIGETMSSRMFQKIREKLGLCYSVGSFYQDYNDLQFFQIYANTSEKYKTKTLDAMYHELESLKKGVTSEEWLIARSQFTGSLLLSDNDYEYHTKRLFNHCVANWPLLDTTQYIEIINSISDKDLEEYLERIVADSWIKVIG
ncbi:M16 family metallopeptidase [Spirochaeta cellobiosiphila]|uniref:M16 family metallopeptidase n=1 Tax=Spirochaeta cellobiosiphila TaxID=504483 RepID=UPI00056428B1|nr:pitrilysin family protein [Spirochaeta cellobiosiphila]